MFMLRTMILRLLFSVCLIFSLSSSSSSSSSLPSSSSSISLSVSASPIETHSKYAYVALHYEGTPNDDAYVLALRVLVTSIKLTGTPHDVVVLISDNVSETTRSLLRSDGALVRPVPNIPNPFKTALTRRNSYKARFEFTFNKLYLWNMTEYQRVLYLDSDNIVNDQRMDHLFMCGHFCAVYQNPSFFHTGLLVVKPDLQKFNQLLTALNAANAFSYDGADQGFLIEQFMELEAAPLFQYKNVKDGKPFEEPAMRVPIIYNMNAMFYYLNFDWNYYRRDVYPFGNETLPFVSLGYPAAATLKPWFWWVHAFLINSHQWNLMRAHITEDSYLPYVFTKIAILIISVVGARVAVSYGEKITQGIRKGMYKDVSPILLFPLKLYMVMMDQLRRATCWLTALAPIRVGYAVGLFAWIFAFYNAAKQIPKLAPPTVAYPLFVIYHCVVVCVILYIYITLLIPTQTKQTNVDQRELSAAVQAVSPIHNHRLPLYMVLGDTAIFIMLLGPFHIHFIGSLYYVIASFALNITLHAHFFRLAAEHMSCLPVRDDLP